MTASDIVQIAVTVGVVQMVCDVIGYFMIYRKETYQRNVTQLARAETKLQKAKADLEKQKRTMANNTSTTTTAGSKKQSSTGSSASAAKQVERYQKAHDRAEQDVARAQALVTRFQLVFRILVALIFLILLKVYGTEHKGKVIGVLPFAPFALLRRITSRGLELPKDPAAAAFEALTPQVHSLSQGCSFLCIYLLINMSVKFYVSKIFGTTGPRGTDNFNNIMDSPLGHYAMKYAGLEPPTKQD